MVDRENKMKLDEVVKILADIGDPNIVMQKSKKFGVVANNALGVYQKDLNVLAKKIGNDNDLAIALFDSGIYEARILCAKIFKPLDLTEDLMESWLVTFENWEICDSFSMGLFAKSPLAKKKIFAWASRSREFEKRASFATMAAYCMADKKSDNAIFETFFPVIKGAVEDERLYVKKAVNWALRNIGKRNIDLNAAAISVAREILKTETKSAQWIANDAIRQLEKPGINILDYPRVIYRVKRSNR